jgi:hypothetical protein
MGVVNQLADELEELGWKDPRQVTMEERICLSRLAVSAAHMLRDFQKREDSAGKTKTEDK